MANGDVLQVVSGHQVLAATPTHAHSTLVPKPGSPVAFTVNPSAPAANVTFPAALGSPTGLVLLTDVITYLGTLQTRIDLLEGLLRKHTDILTTGGMASEV